MKRIHAVLIAILMLPSLVFAADNPFAGVRDLMASRRYKEAREQLVKARDAFAAQSNLTGEAAALMLLGATDSSLNDPVSARKELEAAAEKFIALEDFFTAWLSLTALAELERLEGQNDASIAAHERAVAMLQRAADPKARFTLDTMKILGPALGMPMDMLGPVADYPEVAKPILLRLAEALAREAYAAALIETGALEEAEEQLTQAGAAASLFGGMFDAPIAKRMGDVRQRQWRLEEARESYLKALNGSGPMRMMTSGDPAAELSILGRLAELDVFTGRIEEALAWNDKALTIVRGLKEPKREADVLQARAGLLQKAARYDAARALYEDVLKLATKNEDRYRQASIHADLGALHMFQGVYETSAGHLIKAIELYQQLGEPYLEAPTWLILAEVHLHLDMHDSVAFDIENAQAAAKKSGFKLVGVMAGLLMSMSEYTSGRAVPGKLEQAFKILSELPEATGLPIAGMQQAIEMGTGVPVNQGSAGAAIFGPPMAQALPMFVRGKVLLDRGDYKGARAIFSQALETNPNNDIRAGLLSIIGVSYWAEGNREEGIRYFTQAVETLDRSADDIQVEEMLAGYFGSHRRWYYDLLIDMLVREGRTADAFAQAERARARAFLQMVGNHRFNAERGADPRLVREAEILRTEIAAGERQAGRSADLERARGRYKMLLTRVKASNPEYESLTNIEPLKLEDVRAQLPPDTAMISYFVSSKVVHAWVVDRNGARHTLLPVDRAGLQRIVCWTRAFGGLGTRGVKLLDGCDDAATAEDVFDQLVAPLLTGIEQRKLILVPHGVLHYIPFAALRNRENGRYLLDDYTLTYAPSASALRFLSAKESPVDGGSLVIGNPDAPMSELPGAAEEAVTVAKMLSTTPHVGADGREALLYDLHGKSDLIHLAAHGVYDPVNPLFSRIALAPGGTYDGSLTVHEILSSVDLTGVNLVVLSACQSAVGARSGGDEVVGLTRALLYAGTPGVISTLWNIDDAASAGLMKEFYGRLTSGAHVADALRQAQLAVKANQRTSDPRYWAAFVLTGEPRGRWKRAE